MSKAKVVHKQGRMSPNGREMIAQVRMGEKGTGQQVGNSVIYWPWSARSTEKADEILSAIADDNELELSFEAEE